MLIPSARMNAQSTCNGGSSCSVTTDFVLSISYVARLSLSVPPVADDGITSSEIAAGTSNLLGPTLTVQSNVPYRVEVQATQTHWTYLGTAVNPNKPSSDLLWSTAPNGTYKPSNISSQFMPATVGSAPATSGTDATIYFRSLWNWTSSPPGNYKLPVSFTLVAP